MELQGGALTRGNGATKQNQHHITNLTLHYTALHTKSQSIVSQSAAAKSLTHLFSLSLVEICGAAITLTNISFCLLVKPVQYKCVKTEFTQTVHTYNIYQVYFIMYKVNANGILL